MKIVVSCVKNQDLLHNIALTLGAMSVTNIVTLSWTAHTEYLLQEPQQHITNSTKVTTPNQFQGTTVKIETGKADPDHSPTFKDITAQVIVICIEATLDCNTRTDVATTGAAHDDLTQTTEDTTSYLTMTHHPNHITDHPNIKALQVINPEITVDHIHTHPTDLPDLKLTDQIHIPAE